MLDDLAPRAGFCAEIAVLPISVAALMTPKWVARHLSVSEGIDRVILPGHCRGDLTPIDAVARGVPVELGPEDLRDLPRYFGQSVGDCVGYGALTSRSWPRSTTPPAWTRPRSFGRRSNFACREPT